MGRTLDPADHKKLKRIEIEGRARALNSTCFHNKPFLRSERAIYWFAEVANAALEKHSIHLWAYAIMPTHFHLLVKRPVGASPIPEFLFTLKNSIAKRAIRWTRQHVPTKLHIMLDRQPNGNETFRFWQRGGGYDRSLWSAKAIWNMIDYIHRNPVEAGLCAKPAEWRWSSALWYLERKPGLLNLDLSLRPPDSRHVS